MRFSAQNHNRQRGLSPLFPHSHFHAGTTRIIRPPSLIKSDWSRVTRTASLRPNRSIARKAPFISRSSFSRLSSQQTCTAPNVPSLRSITKSHSVPSASFTNVLLWRHIIPSFRRKWNGHFVASVIQHSRACFSARPERAASQGLDPLPRSFKGLKLQKAP